MAAILSMLRRSPKTTPQPPSSRKRLQKKVLGKEDSNIQSEDITLKNPSKETTRNIQFGNTGYPDRLSLKLDGVLDKGFVDSCLDLVFKSAEDLTLVEKEILTAEEHPFKNLPHKQSTLSSDSASFYSVDEMVYSGLKRTRAKTPVFMIGQLEKISEQKVQCPAQRLAEEYRLSLPPRAFSPCPSTRAPRTLRKIKCQVSLRDLNKAQEDLPKSPGSEYSEGETLIGSESATPYSASPRNSLRKMTPPIEDWHHEQPEIPDAKAAMENDIGMKICTELLTKELASALSRHDKVEINDRASELQILLMIEAYELVQKQIQEKREDLHVPEDHVSSFELLLDHWLSVLYTVYDRSQEKVRHEEIMNLECQCKGPLPIHLSTEHRRT